MNEEKVTINIGTDTTELNGIATTIRNNSVTKN